MPVAQRIALGNSSRTCSTKDVVRPEKPEEREDVSRKPCKVATRGNSVTLRSSGERKEKKETDFGMVGSLGKQPQVVLDALLQLFRRKSQHSGRSQTRQGGKWFRWFRKRNC